jgi:hypothetical protein
MVVSLPRPDLYDHRGHLSSLISASSSRHWAAVGESSGATVRNSARTARRNIQLVLLPSTRKSKMRCRRWHGRLCASASTFRPRSPKPAAGTRRRLRSKTAQRVHHKLINGRSVSELFRRRSLDSDHRRDLTAFEDQRCSSSRLKRSHFSGSELRPRKWKVTTSIPTHATNAGWEQNTKSPVAHAICGAVRQLNDRKSWC